MKRKKTDNPYWKKLRQISMWYWGFFLCSFLAVPAYIRVTDALHRNISEAGLGYLRMFRIMALLGLIPYIMWSCSLIGQAKGWHEPPADGTKAGRPLSSRPVTPAPASGKAKAPQPAAQQNVTDVLSLLNCPPSYGDEVLSRLELMVKDGKPTLLWGVTWRGGYSHADSAGDCLPIPESVLREMTAASLVDWISSQSFMVKDTDLSPFKKDVRVMGWCAAHRLSRKSDLPY